MQQLTRMKQWKKSKQLILSLFNEEKITLKLHKMNKILTFPLKF